MLKQLERNTSCPKWQTETELCTLYDPETLKMHGSMQGWTGLLKLPGSPMKWSIDGWILPGSTLGKVIQSTSSNSKTPGGALARPLAMPGPGSQPHGFCRGCPGLAPCQLLVDNMQILCFAHGWKTSPLGQVVPGRPRFWGMPSTGIVPLLITNKNQHNGHGQTH